MPRPSVDRAAVADYVNRHYREHGKRPGAREVATHLGHSAQSVQGAMNALDAAGQLEGEPLAPGRRVDKRLEALRAIRAYQLTHTWAPSQAEVAEMIGVGLQRANSTLEQLAAEGRIVIGPGARQLYITGTTVKIPAVKEPK